MNERLKCYPTINGVSVSLLDIWLPKSNLNPDKDKNYNNHHGEWTARKFGQSILFQVFRDLQAHQEYAPIDVHNWVHAHYDPPKMPTPLEAMNRVDQAFCESEKLHIRKSGSYILKLLDIGVYDKCDENYNRLTRR